MKEQREQENRKHEQHARFLQNELRHLNQALTLKQHEATNTHQENARLLAELAHAQSALRAAQEEVRTLKQQGDQLAFCAKAGR